MRKNEKMSRKLKPSWMQTDMPKDIKIELWRLMQNNPTYGSWWRALAKIDTEKFGLSQEEERKFIKTSNETYKRLKQEIQLMPKSEVEKLPEDLQQWITDMRPELTEEPAIVPKPKEVVEDKKHFDDLVDLCQRILLICEYHEYNLIYVKTIGELPEFESGMAFSGKYRVLQNSLLDHLKAQFPKLTGLKSLDELPVEYVNELRQLAAKREFKGTCEMWSSRSS